MTVLNSFDGFFDLNLSLVAVPDEDLKKLENSHVGSHTLHEHAHAQTLRGTDYYSEYAKVTLISGPRKARAECFPNEITSFLEAVPSAIRSYGEEQHSHGTEPDQNLVKALHEAADAYFVSVMRPFYNGPPDPLLTQAGLSDETVQKRTIVTGLARAAIDEIVHKKRTNTQLLTPLELLHRLTSRLKTFSPAQIPTNNDSVFTHIRRLMSDSPNVHRLVDKNQQLNSVLVTAPADQVRTHAHLFPALLGFEWLVHDSPNHRYVNWFDSFIATGTYYAKAVCSWLSLNAPGADTEMGDLCCCFRPFKLGGLEVMVPQEPNAKIGKVLLYLQIREFFRRLPDFLRSLESYQDAAAKTNIELLEAEADDITQMYLKQVETSIARYRGMDVDSLAWNPEGAFEIKKVNKKHCEVILL